MDELDIYLKEDLAEEGDITSNALFTDETSKGSIIAREECVVAGISEIEKIFKKFDIKFVFHVKDGDFVKKETKIAEISGRAKDILKIERLSLNILGRMSGIATETRKLVEKCKKINPNVQIAATRKTTPGFRRFEKQAVLIAGGESHRNGLYDAIMIKDNHLKIIGSLEEAISKAKKNTKSKTIEVEVENKKDAITAAKMYVDVIMLDNFSSEKAKEAAEEIRRINDKILIEISGGITPDNITGYASFADRISLGYLTHSVKNIDFSLEI